MGGLALPFKWSREQHPRLREALAFAVVGSLGFTVDAGVLAFLFHALAWDHYPARAASFLLAVSVTWSLNRAWTFAHRASASRRREASIYLLLQTLGAGINFAVYGVCLALSPTMRAGPLLALACGSVVAMVFNFLATRHLAFTGGTDVTA